MTNPVAYYAVLHQHLGDLAEESKGPFAKRFRELRSLLSRAAAVAMAEGLDEDLAKADAIRVLRAELSENRKITDDDVNEFRETSPATATMYRVQRNAALLLSDPVLGAARPGRP